MDSSGTRRPRRTPARTRCGCNTGQAFQAGFSGPARCYAPGGNSSLSRRAPGARSYPGAAGTVAGRRGVGTGALDTIHQARFARSGELKKLLSSTPCPDGVLLGTARHLLFFKRYVIIRPEKSRREIGNTLIVGPTRSGKGLLATSQLLSWQHSVIVNDIKGDLFLQTAGYREALGPVFVIDPRGVGHCYDPLQGLHSEDEFYS